MADARGRRAALLLGFGALPARGLLLPLAVDDPVLLVAVQALDGVSAAALGVLLPLLAADLTRGTNRFNLCMGCSAWRRASARRSAPPPRGRSPAAGDRRGVRRPGRRGLPAVLLVLFAMPETLTPSGSGGAGARQHAEVPGDASPSKAEDVASTTPCHGREMAKTPRD